MKQLEIIPINIWDDFYDDGYVPEGEKLETFIYVEDNNIPQEKRKEYLEFLLDYINKNLNTEGIRLWMEFYESKNKYPNLIGTEYESFLFERWEIKVENLTHKKLDEWIDQLGRINLSIDGIPIEVYSES